MTQVYSPESFPEYFNEVTDLDGGHVLIAVGKGGKTTLAEIWYGLMLSKGVKPVNWGEFSASQLDSAMNLFLSSKARKALSRSQCASKSEMDAALSQFTTDLGEDLPEIYIEHLPSVIADLESSHQVGVMVLDLRKLVASTSIKRTSSFQLPTNSWRSTISWYKHLKTGKVLGLEAGKAVCVDPKIGEVDFVLFSHDLDTSEYSSIASAPKDVEVRDLLDRTLQSVVTMDPTSGSETAASSEFSLVQIMEGGEVKGVVTFTENTRDGHFVARNGTHNGWVRTKELIPSLIGCSEGTVEVLGYEEDLIVNSRKYREHTNAFYDVAADENSLTGTINQLAEFSSLRVEDLLKPNVIDLISSISEWYFLDFLVKYGFLKHHFRLNYGYMGSVVADLVYAVYKRTSLHELSAALVSTEGKNEENYDLVLRAEGLREIGLLARLQNNDNGMVVRWHCDQTLMEASEACMVVFRAFHLSTMNSTITDRIVSKTATQKGGLDSSVLAIIQHLSDRALLTGRAMMSECRDDFFDDPGELEVDNPLWSKVRNKMGANSRVAAHLVIENGGMSRGLWFRIKEFDDIEGSETMFKGLTLEHYPDGGRFAKDTPRSKITPT